MRQRYPGVLWILPLLAVVNLTAASPSVVDAVKTGDLRAVRLAISQGDVNAPEGDGTTALHWAVRRGNLDTVDLLIRAGAQVRATTRYGVTPLFVASEMGNAALIERLIAAGADPNTAMPDGETALMTAARSGNPDAIRVLVNRGADVNAKEPKQDQTALMWAAAPDNAAAVRTLLELGANINAKSRRDGARGAYSAYLYAVRAGAIDAARVLLMLGADVNQTTPDGTSALVLAVINAHYELAGVLLDHGADATAEGQGWTALHEIAYAPHTNTGANDPGAQATGKMDYLELAMKLVEHGADVNARQTKEASIVGRQMMNRIGATPFLLAAKHCDVPLMRTLLLLGANPTLMTVEHDTPLMAAAGVGINGVGENAGTNEESFEAAKLILALGDDVAKVNATNDTGSTALHGAAVRGAQALVQLLADSGAILDVRNKPDKRYSQYERLQGGWTPLEMADGIVYGDVFKQDVGTAALLRRLLKERGLPVPEPAYLIDGVAIPRKTGQ